VKETMIVIQVETNRNVKKWIEGGANIEK